MKKKLIGIPMWNQGENSVGATKPYLEYLKQWGNIVLLDPDLYLEGLDLLVLPGGKDISAGNPEDFSFWNSDSERFLEHFDTFTLPKYIKNKTPIYGICRGMQAIMKHFKIPLVQNIDWPHAVGGDKESDVKMHNLTYLKYHAFGAGKNGVKAVGSWHHQGVSMAEMAKQDQFDVIAYVHSSPDWQEFNIVEFAEHRTLPIIVEQSHPERNNTILEKGLIERLLKIDN